MGAVIGFLFIVLLIAAVVGIILLLRGEQLRFVTSATPDQVTMAAVGEIGTKRRWTTLTQGAGTVTFSYYKRPSYILLFILFLFIATIPLAILYAIVGWRREALSVYAAKSDDGETYVQVTSNGWRGKSAGRSIQSQLSVGAGAASSANLARTLTPEPATAPAAAAPTPSAVAPRLEAPEETAPIPMMDMQKSAPCTACGAAMKSGTRFCTACGESLPTACSGCGTTLREEAQFCSSCGLAVPAGAPASSV